MNARSLFSVFSVLLLLVALPAAADSRQRLDAFFAGLQTMRAEFIQTLSDPDGSIREESEGVLLLARPERFRLDYTRPYSQAYVADGQKMWLYDQDLEQVTVRPQDEALDSTPALLLSTGGPLDEAFRIADLGDHEGFAWLELRPHGEESGFEYIRLALDEQTIRAMEMLDSFGQLTRLYFHEVSHNPQLAADAFVFVPPPGVDVVGE